MENFLTLFSTIYITMSKIILIAGPSGVGKGTIEKRLFEDESLNLSFSISATTRNRREGEVEGIHYFFKTKDEFEKLIDQKAFLEYNKHFDNYYGTLISEVESKLALGKNVLIEVETNGALNIIRELKEQGKENALISIFIVPPSMEELKRRIVERKTDSEDQIKKRLERADEEIKCKMYFQYVVKNDNINIAVDEIKNIIKTNA